MLPPVFAALRKAFERRGDGLRVARVAPGGEPLDLPGLRFRRHGDDRFGGIRQRRRFGLDEAVDADHDLLAALDRFDPARIGFDELLLEIALLDRGDGAAHFFDLGQFLFRRLFELGDLGGDGRRAFEHVAVFQQVGLVSEDLLHAQRPLLVPRPRQAERLVPGRQLHGAGACAFRQGDGEHLDQNARDVVFRLLLGQAERVDLHAVAEQPLLGVGDAVALARDLVPQFGKGAQLADFGDEAQPGIDEERDAPDHVAEFLRRALARRLAPHRARRWRWRARRPIPAPASRRLPAGDRSTRSSDSISAFPWS